MTPRSAPGVLIIDDEVKLRWSVQSLLKAARLRSESFGTASAVGARSLAFLGEKPSGMNRAKSKIIVPRWR
jgi:FixJ family two-component response regulator